MPKPAADSIEVVRAAERRDVQRFGPCAARVHTLLIQVYYGTNRCTYTVYRKIWTGSIKFNVPRVDLLVDVYACHLDGIIYVNAATTTACHWTGPDDNSHVRYIVYTHTHILTSENFQLNSYYYTRPRTTDSRPRITYTRRIVDQFARQRTQYVRYNI